ncbi:hypothetical protein SAMN02745130_01055 [Thiothrix eikelboomii]|uniref:Uncharacterized protein n=1 Tax=Thiothrix eikelboomii TaxID=92487 RepID=A0A1T4W5G0_9GAMM|nr:hypothetical protein [Thiothrix eikelboomii]SKA72379.1 hypothetical protein SAMN02745130_01055 [Thiothrix eikelboomii]
MNPQNEQSTNQGRIQIAYWPDGYWSRDLAEAAKMDEFQAFGEVPHKVVDLPADSSEDAIAEQVLTLCAGLSGSVLNQPCVPCAQGSNSTDKPCAHTHAQ